MRFAFIPFFVAAVATPTVPAPPGTASTWVVAGHDAQATAFNNTERLITPINVARLHRVWLAPGYTSAIATDTRVYAIKITEASGVSVNVLNAANGRNLLTYTPAMLHLTRGVKDLPSTLAHPDDTLVVGSTREIVGLNPHTGKLLWYRYGGATALTAQGSTLYATKSCSGPCGPSASMALTLATGRVLWRRPGAASGPPVLVGGAAYLRTGAASTTVDSLATGVPLATIKLNARWTGDMKSVYAFVPSAGPKARAWAGLLRPDGGVTWKADLGRAVRGNPVLAYGALFVPSFRTALGVVALNVQSGRLIWGADTGVTDAMVAANHLLYILHGSTGRVDILQAATGHILRTIALSPWTAGAHPDLFVAGGTLYVVSGSGIAAYRP